MTKMKDKYDEPGSQVGWVTPTDNPSKTNDDGY